MNVPVVNGFSGVSGNATDTHRINWPVLPWPAEYDDNYNYQWEQKLIPYWKEINTEAEAAGVKSVLSCMADSWLIRLITMLKLRDAAGKAIGCNTLIQAICGGKGSIQWQQSRF